jgi:hypothetical protein
MARYEKVVSSIRAHRKAEYSSRLDKKRLQEIEHIAGGSKEGV